MGNMANKTTDEVILTTSPEAATYKTGISGWVSRTGHFCGDGPDSERMARFDGATHSPCQVCGEPVERGWTKCGFHREVERHERWLALPVGEWKDGEPAYSQKLDKYFFHEEEVDEEESGELDLVTCEPEYASEVSADYWADSTPEDDDIPGWLDTTLEAFNAEIRKHSDSPLSWYPGRCRIDLTPTEVAPA